MPKAKQRKTSDEILERLKNLDGISTELSFIKLISKSDKQIVVRYAGHEESGSYVYASSIIPGYITTLQKITNRNVKVKHNTRDGGIGFDAYDCTIDLTNVLSATEEKRKTVGKLIYANGYYAFRCCAGREWAMCYGIMERATDTKFLNATKLSISPRDREIIEYDGVEIFKKLDRQPSYNRHFVGSSSDCNRTYYSATFDLYIDEYELSKIYLELIKDSLNFNLKTNERTYEVDEVFYETPQHQSEHIMYTFTNTTFNELGPRVGHLPSIVDKSLSNEDYNVQCWDVGTSLKDFTYEDDKLIQVKIESFDYDVKEGPVYGIKARLNKDNKLLYAYRSLKHTEMIDLFEPQFTKVMDIEHYRLFMFPGFITSDEANYRRIQYHEEQSTEDRYRHRYNSNDIVKEIDLQKSISDYGGVGTLNIYDRHDDGIVYSFAEIREKTIVQNVFNAKNNMYKDEFYHIPVIKDSIKMYIDKYRTNEKELDAMKKVIRQSPSIIKKRQIRLSNDIEREMVSNKDKISNLIRQKKEIRDIYKNIMISYNNFKDRGLFDKYNITKVSPRLVRNRIGW